MLYRPEKWFPIRTAALDIGSHARISERAGIRRDINEAHVLWSGHCCGSAAAVPVAAENADGVPSTSELAEPRTWYASAALVISRASSSTIIVRSTLILEVLEQMLEPALVLDRLRIIERHLSLR